MSDGFIGALRNYFEGRNTRATIDTCVICGYGIKEHEPHVGKEHMCMKCSRWSRGFDDELFVSKTGQWPYHMNPEFVSYITKNATPDDKISILKKIHAAEKIGLQAYTIHYSTGYYKVYQGRIIDSHGLSENGYKAKALEERACYYCTYWTASDGIAEVTGGWCNLFAEAATNAKYCIQSPNKSYFMPNRAVKNALVGDDWGTILEQAPEAVTEGSLRRTRKYNI